MIQQPDAQDQQGYYEQDQDNPDYDFNTLPADGDFGRANYDERDVEELLRQSGASMGRGRRGG